MATYTLSFTGAQVNAAIGNATNLFSTTHTWTAVQTIQTPIITAPTVTGTAQFADVVVDGDLTVTGTALFGDFESNVIIRAVDMEVSGSLTLGAASAFTCDGTVQFNDDVDLAGNLSVGGELTASITASDDLDMDGYNIGNATRIAVTSVFEIGNGKVYLQFSGAGIASATYAGCYINTSGITAFAQGAAIPVNVLVIYINA